MRVRGSAIGSDDILRWFPIIRECLESDEFGGLTPAEKIYYWHLIERFGFFGGPFGEPDARAAAKIGVSEGKIRVARRKLRDMHWVHYKSGFYVVGRGAVSTRFRWIKWTNLPEKGSGGWFAKMHCHAFNCIVARVRKGVFSHADLVTYVVLCYLRHKYSRNRSSFYATKKELRKLLGVADAVARIRNLYERFTFKSGARLFEYLDEYNRVYFSDWRDFADPSEGEHARTRALKLEDEIKERYQELRPNLEEVENWLVDRELEKDGVFDHLRTR